MNARLTFVHALSPLHAGTGQGIGVIDLPVAREQATDLPFIPGSSLKGVLRDQCTDLPTRTGIFGPDTANAEVHAGSVQITDQRLLLLPVRSMVGTFAWVTSPYVLRRLCRDLSDAGLPVPAKVPLTISPHSSSSAKANAIVCKGSGIGLPIGETRTVLLEDLDLVQVAQDEHGEAPLWATWLGKRIFPKDLDWQRELTKRFCIVDDDVLTFLLQTALEVRARIKLQEDTKTVEKGGLWYEEALPTETILAGLAVATPTEKAGIKATQIFETLTDLTKQVLQVGGKSTVGYGLCRVRIADRDSREAQAGGH